MQKAKRRELLLHPKWIIPINHSPLLRNYGLIRDKDMMK